MRKAHYDTEIDFPPRGTFQGTNFMTPEVKAYYKRTIGGRVAYVELSEGSGFNHEPIYGVTFRRDGGGRLDPDPSKMFKSRTEAERWARTGR